MLLGKEGYYNMQIYKLAEAGHSDRGTWSQMSS